MKKIVTVIIDNCNDCPNFNNHECPCYDGEETCMLLNRKIKYVGSCQYEIPADCPLETKED